MSLQETAEKKFNDKTAVIGIVGLGYVGLPLALRFCEVGFQVKGIDISKRHVGLVNEGESYITHIPSDRIKACIKSRLLEATTDYSVAQKTDALIICVPTPLNKYREPDLSFVINTMESLLPHLKRGQIVSLESTTYPGTTDEEIVPRIEKQGLKVGENLFVVFSPEREDPGNPNFHTQTIPKICGGVTASCLSVGVAMYQQVINKVVAVSSTRAAEMTKLLENIHRSVNIGLVNEMKMVCDKMNIDIFEVIKAAATKPFGFTAYYPGPGLGGHCIPIDPFYLTWKAREYGVHTKFIELAGEINTNMPHWVIEKTTEALNQLGRSVKNSKVLVLGIAYKKNINDMRESPSVELMELLLHRGAEVDYSDPYVPVFPPMRKHAFDKRSKDLSPALIASYDCVLIATNHDVFNYKMILENARLIIDTRGVYPEANSKVVRA